QALEPLPAVDGPQGHARLRVVVGDPAGEARDPHGHAHSSRRPPPSPDAPQGGRLADGPRDHEPPRALRSAGPRALRLRALPHRHSGNLPGRPPTLALSRMSGSGSVSGRAAPNRIPSPDHPITRSPDRTMKTRTLL